MALVKCPECGKEVSSAATACPHCGCPVTPPKVPAKESKSGPGSLVLLAIISIGLAIWALSGSDEAPPAQAASPAPVQTQAEKDRDAGMGLVGIAVASVKASLKDSDSAKFRNVFAVKTKTGELVACGEVNARNSFGGYTGFKPFVTEGDAIRIQNSDNPNAVVRRWNATCAKAPSVYRSHRND